MTNTSTKEASRRKFLKWSGLSSLALFAGLQFRKIFIANKKTAAAEQLKNNTVKMLTEDGKLVEVATRDLGCANKKMISDDELKSWVKHP